MQRLLDALIFSSLWVALVAGTLCTAVSLAIGLRPQAASVGIAMCGAFLIYNIDRLRDLERDRKTAPIRSAFIARHAPRLVAACVLAGIGAATFAIQLGPAPLLLLAIVLALGLFHRRLKTIPMIKAGYISGAWLAVVIGVPALSAADPRHTGWVTAILGLSVFSNVVASSIRDQEAAAEHFGPVRTLAAARGFALLGLLVSLLSPDAIRALMAVPATTLLAVFLFEPTERFGLLVLDGALALGAAVSIFATL